MTDAVGLTVVINPGRGEAGEIVIRYKTMEQFDMIHRALLAQRKG
jgi:ParB family chromosome partitioning protein